MTIGFIYLFIYLKNLTTISNFRDGSVWKKINSGATITHSTINIKPKNIFINVPILNILGDIFMPGQTNTILVEYEYQLNGVKYVSRKFDFLNYDYPNKLDVQVVYDKLHANGGTVDYYLNVKSGETFIVLNDVKELGLPWVPIIYFIIGLFCVYGGYIAPDLYHTIPATINKFITTKFGSVPLDLELDQD